MKNKEYKIHIIAVCYEKFEFLKTFVQSVINQTNKNWILTVIHDGPNENFNKLMIEYKNTSPDQIHFKNTSERYNDYGHSLRDQGLKQILGDYVILTNADNYFVPKAIELINKVLNSSDKEIDVIMYNYLASHHNYINFVSSYKRHYIDISAAAVKKDLAERAGFKDKSYDGDATYFEDIAKLVSPNKLTIFKINSSLLVHN